MKLFVDQVDVWAATINDQPGALAAALSELRDAGADLQFIIARRTREDSGKGVVFVTPLESDSEIAAAAQAGFNVAQSLHCIRIAGTDRPGLAAGLTQRLADGGVNLLGFSASVVGTQFVAYVAVDSLKDLNASMRLMKDA